MEDYSTVLNVVHMKRKEYLLLWGKGAIRDKIEVIIFKALYEWTSTSNSPSIPQLLEFLDHNNFDLYIWFLVSRKYLQYWSTQWVLESYKVVQHLRF